MKKGICLIFFILIAAGMVAAATTNDVGRDNSSSSSPVAAYFANWFIRVAATQAEQPHWAPPVAMTSPNLTEVLRYDMMWQNLPNGHTLGIYSSGKGVELIPAEKIEVIIGLRKANDASRARAHVVACSCCHHQSYRSSGHICFTQPENMPLPLPTTFLSSWRMPPINYVTALLIGWLVLACLFVLFPPAPGRTRFARHLSGIDRVC